MVQEHGILKEDRGYLLKVFEQAADGVRVRRVLFAVPGSAPPRAPEGHLNYLDHPRVELVLRGRSENTFVSGTAQTTETLGAGDALVLPARAWDVLTGRFGGTFLSVVLWPDFTRFVCVTLPTRQRLERYTARWWHTAEPPPAELTECFSALAAMGRHGSSGDAPPALLEAVLKIARDVLRADEFSPHGRTFELWRDANAFVHEHCGRDIDRASVAEALGVHPNYLSRIFARHGSESFNEHLNRARIDRARMLLADRSQTVEDVSALCGFRSASYFIKVFRRVTGSTPGRFRE